MQKISGGLEKISTYKVAISRPLRRESRQVKQNGSDRIWITNIDAPRLNRRANVFKLTVFFVNHSRNNIVEYFWTKLQ